MYNMYGFFLRVSGWDGIDDVRKKISVCLMVIYRKLQRINNQRSQVLIFEIGIGLGQILCFCFIFCLKGFYIVMNLCMVVMGIFICDFGRDRFLSISLVIYCFWIKFNLGFGQKDIYIVQQIIFLRLDVFWMLDVE